MSGHEDFGSSPDIARRGTKRSLLLAGGRPFVRPRVSSGESGNAKASCGLGRLVRLRDGRGTPARDERRRSPTPAQPDARNPSVLLITTSDDCQCTLDRCLVAKQLVSSTGLGRANLILKRAAGVLIALVGVYLFV